MGLNFSEIAGKKILVTGHTGFKGTWLVKMLSDLGGEVYGLSLPPEQPRSLYEQIDITNVVVAETLGDICDPDIVADVFSRYQPEIVFHLAAQAFVREAYSHPLRTIQSNVIGTFNVLFEACNSQGTECVISVTTDKVYQNQDWVWAYREDDRLGGKDIYSASKAACELVIQSVRAVHNPRSIPVISVRAGNVVGGGDWGKDRLLPDLALSMADSKPISIRYPDATRPWQHVLDCLSGYISAAIYGLRSSQNLSFDTFNFGPDGSLTVSEVLSVFMSAYGREVPILIEKAEFLEHTKLEIDASRAKAVLGWEPKFSPAEAVTAAASWYSSVAQGDNPNSLINKEIEKFWKL